MLLKVEAGMSRETLDRIEQELLDEILILGSMVEKATLDSVESLRTRDVERARQIYDNDQKINEKRFEIENSAIIALATQQPLATDLRILASVLEICTELERMGDYAKGIAKINIRMGDEPLLKPLIDIPKMAEIATEMLQMALTSFVNQDVDVIDGIVSKDDLVDNLYEAVYKELIGITTKDPSVADRANYLLWAAHNMERLADRVTNICERTYYVKTGELIEITDRE
jgi:phosphate transport system protein